MLGIHMQYWWEHLMDTCHMWEDNIGRIVGMDWLRTRPVTGFGITSSDVQL
jgi:hypothetical protein